MNSTNPVDALCKHYQGLSIEARDELFASIFKEKASRKQQVIATVSSFVLVTCIAAILLTTAGRPSRDGDQRMLATIAKYQMISSGLVDNSIEHSKVAR